MATNRSTCKKAAEGEPHSETQEFEAEDTHSSPNEDACDLIHRCLSQEISRLLRLPPSDHLMEEPILRSTNTGPWEGTQELTFIRVRKEPASKQ